MGALKLHSTYQSNIYYIGIHQLPKELISQIKNTEAEVEYTVGESMGFIRGELTLDGQLFEFEVSLGSVDIQHAGYEYSDELDSYIDDTGREIDADEHAEFMLSELMSYACEIENLDVYLTKV